MLTRFWIKTTLFAAPLLILLTLDNFVLPRGFFCFRAWETLITFNANLPGRFYPNQTLQRIDFGDLGYGTKFAVPKKVTWITDGRGSRNLPGDEFNTDILIVGDSMTVGSSLDQKDTLATQLEKSTGLKTRCLHGMARKAMIEIDRFFNPKPRILIWEVVERNIPLLEPASTDLLKIRNHRQPPVYPGWWNEFFTRLDYFQKLSPIRAARSGLDRSLTEIITEKIDPQIYQEINKGRVTRDGRMITMQGSWANQSKDEKQIEQCAQTIASYKESARKRGVTLIFLPVPNKESVYWDQLTPAIKPTFLSLLVKRVRELGIPTVDLQSAMAQTLNQHPQDLLYHLDDSHWNAKGVAVAVQELKTMIAPNSSLSEETAHFFQKK